MELVKVKPPVFVGIESVEALLDLSVEEKRERVLSGRGKGQA